jgi:hypothetical protein
MPILFILIPIIILFYYSFTFFFIYTNYFEHNLIAINFLIYAILPLFFFSKTLNIQKIKNNFSFSILKQKTAGVFFLLVTIFVIILIGVPLLSESINATKTNVSSHPLLVRFFRIGLPFYIIYTSLYHTKNKFDISFRNKITITSLFIAPFFGFKGYIFFILWPIFFDLSIRKRKHFFKYSAYFLILLLTILVSTVSFIESKNLTESAEYIVLRLTNENLLGNILALDNQNAVQGIYPIYSEIVASVTRIIGSREVNLLQSKLYEIYMGDNPYNMQVSVSSVIEYYVSFGKIGFLIHFIIITSTLYLIKKMVYSSRPILIVIGIMFLNTIYESILNGLFLFKIFDITISLLIIYLSTELVFSLIIKKKSTIQA